MSSSPFAPWRLEWSGEHVRRFWDWFSRNPAMAPNYFSLQYGDSILEQVARVTELAGQAVDLGAGPGHLVEHLLRRGLTVTAVDASADSVSLVSRRYSGARGFQGAVAWDGGPAPVADSSVDMVFLVEAAEHMDEPVLSGVLAEVRRVLKVGGRLVVTTPHDEVLARLETMCPSCGCVFHTVQHVRAFTAASLEARLASAGFSTVHCRSTLFSSLPRALRPLQRARWRVQRRSLPHLLYVGRR